MKAKKKNANTYSSLTIVVLFGTIVGLFYLFYYSGLYTGHLNSYFLSFLAAVVSKSLLLFGVSNERYETSLYTDQFSFEIVSGCDGLEGMAFLIAGIIAFPIAFRWKWQGVIAGIVLLFFVNLLRILLLYLVGSRFSTYFEFAHHFAGFILYSLAALVIWIYWVQWANLQKAKYHAKTTH